MMNAQLILHNASGSAKTLRSTSRVGPWMKWVRHFALTVVFSLAQGLPARLYGDPVDAQISISSNTNFGRVHILGSSITGFIRATNVGTVPVSISSCELAGAPEFMMFAGASVPSILQPTQSLQWNFNFVPIEEGERTALFRIWSDAAGSPHEVTLRALAVNTPLGPWEWRYVGSPSGSRMENSIFVDPSCDSIWYVTSMSGLYVTRDAGSSWKKSPLPSLVHSEAFSLDQLNPNRCYVASYNELFATTDRGISWRRLHAFPNGDAVTSLLASSFSGNILVPYGTDPQGDGANPGVYCTTDSGKTWSFSSFDFPMENLICWDIEEDPVTGTLYVSTEIGHHPTPYHPPLFRSTNGGVTWADVSQGLPWHVVKIQVDSANHSVYTLTEGAGLFKSTDGGASWHCLSNYFWLDLFLDRQQTNQLFGGTHTWRGAGGGAFFSKDSGLTFVRIGLTDLVVSSITTNAQATQVYVASYGAGIFVAPVPLASNANVENKGSAADRFALQQNYPNPFNPSTTIRYEVPGSSIVRLSVYDILGREVSVLVNERRDAGMHEVKFDGTGLSSGVYFYRLQAKSFVETRKTLLLR